MNDQEQEPAVAAVEGPWRRMRGEAGGSTRMRLIEVGADAPGGPCWVQVVTDGLASDGSGDGTWLMLTPDEVDQAADELHRLAGYAASVEAMPAGGPWDRARRMLAARLDQYPREAAERVAIGGDDELPVTLADLLGLLGGPPEVPAGARARIGAGAAHGQGGHTGLLWAEVVQHDGCPAVAVCAVEGDASPYDGYWSDDIARYTPAGARALGQALRAAAADARRQPTAVPGSMS